jgi:hypothetical protein
VYVEWGELAHVLFDYEHAGKLVTGEVEGLERPAGLVWRLWEPVLGHQALCARQEPVRHVLPKHAVHDDLFSGGQLLLGSVLRHLKVQVGLLLPDGRVKVDHLAVDVGRFELLD